MCPNPVVPRRQYSGLVAGRALRGGSIGCRQRGYGRVRVAPNRVPGRPPTGAAAAAESLGMRGLAAATGYLEALGSRALKLLPFSGRDRRHILTNMDLVFAELSRPPPVYPGVGGLYT